MRGKRRGRGEERFLFLYICFLLKLFYFSGKWPI